MTDEEFNRIIVFRKKHRASVDPDVHHGPMYEHEDGSIRKKLVVAAKGLRVGLKFGCMQTSEKRLYTDYDSPMVPPREGDIVDFNPTTPLYLALCLSSLAMAKIGPVITLLHPCDQR